MILKNFLLREASLCENL